MAYQIKFTKTAGRIAYNFCKRAASTSSLPITFSEEVLQAKSKDSPIVALESTIITHGMPYPHNLKTALKVETIIRERGATPATVAILKGQLTVGLSEDQLSYLAQAQGVVKTSRRDLAPVVAAKRDGATTVAGTIIAADLAGIPVFVTGGIGGVHREGERTLDISADLTELGRSSTLVVCSGVKSILDIGRTLEYLETQGVCVCAYGDTDEFPAFYTRRSGHRAPHRAATPREAALLIHASQTMRLTSGIVIAVPIPEKYAMDESLIENAIQEALKDANEKGIKGKEVTPFILAAVARATGGASLDANIALIKNNAQVGADIAVELKKLKDINNLENTRKVGSLSSTKSSPGFSRGFHTSCCSRFKVQAGGRSDFPLFGSERKSGGDVLVIGGANVDRTYRLKELHVQLDGSTHPCSKEKCGGGVGRNIAEALWRIRGGQARLLTALGDDEDGKYLAEIAPGLILEGCVMKGARTSTYSAVLDARGGCLLGLGDMDLHDSITPDLVDKHLDVLMEAPLIVIDGNAPQRTIEHVIQLCHENGKPVFFEPTDKRKATKPLQCQYGITYASPNLSELYAMATHINPNFKSNIDTTDEKILKLAAPVLNVAQFLLVTRGAQGVITIQELNHNLEYLCVSPGIVAKLYSSQEIKSVESVSGAGDCFTSGFIHGILSGCNENVCISLGFEAATQTLLSKNTVPTQLKLSSRTTEAKYIIL